MKISNKEKKTAESDAPRSTLFIHNIATINTVLAGRIGPPAKTKVPKKAVGLSYNPTSDSDEATEQLPVSPFFTRRPIELSECLTGADEEGEVNREKAYGLGKLLPSLKARMGWYKVLRQSFDYAPASLDSILFERGVKEPDSIQIEAATLIKMERESRTL